MTFTGRIRLYLITVAIVTPLILLAVIYYFLSEQERTFQQTEAFASLRRFEAFDKSLRTQTLASVEALLADDRYRREIYDLTGGRSNRLTLDPHTHGLDFLEILDSDSVVRASYHRPGLIGEAAQLPLPGTLSVTLEYDRDGGHLAYTVARPDETSAITYTGRYLTTMDLSRMALAMDARVEIFTDQGRTTTYSRMEPMTLYENDDCLEVVLLQDQKVGWYLVATYDASSATYGATALLWATALVAVLSTVLAIALGMIITGRAKREIDNLVQASSRVAAGDFSTPVMAYEEGEFSQLADSLSEMMTRLKAIQNDLAVSEKIAAWQQMGRKVAHEIKNPLTPISIGIDDLHRSYFEKQPGYDQILKDTTSTIKREIGRMTQLLDQFVRFARMKPPEIIIADCRQLLEEIASLYQGEVASGRLTIDKSNCPAQGRLDPDGIKQVLINLIKNGLETASDTTVELSISDQHDTLEIGVCDTGAGFPDEVLDDPFLPYRTTKGGGSGLGLVIAHRIVHDHGGTMVLYNREEGGAGVRIELPA
jgi:signal transduction histidine kinase